MNATREQLRAFRGSLNSHNLQDMKDELVLQFTSGRTTHSSEMSIQEMRSLISHIEGTNLDSTNNVRADQMRRRILSMCYSLGWTSFDSISGANKVDMERLDNWMRKYSYKHKELAKYDYYELTRLVTQFENMLKSTYV